MNPIALEGNWDVGYALDIYTISSKHCGQDEYGKDRFHNEYSRIGKMVNKLKYHLNLKKAQCLANASNTFISSEDCQFENIGAIIPVPPSKGRDVQPVFKIAKHLADLLKISCTTDVLIKTSSGEAKGRNISDIEITKTKTAKIKMNVLLIDDVYRSGDTLNACCNVLRNDKKIEKIFVLVMAKTRT